MYIYCDHIFFFIRLFIAFLGFMFVIMVKNHNNFIAFTFENS